MSPTDPVADPFGTADRRDAILAAWRSSPTRFREDANAEEDLVLGGYADRLLVELTSNAADAAARTGQPGRVAVRLVSTPDGGTALSVANTGAALDAAGVDSLTSLRASAKRGADDTAGRFGVGFSAVLAVTDAPEVRSTSGGVRFSAAGTAAAIGSDDALRAEADRRGGRLPVLRLAWPVDTAPPAGFDTEVLLPLRDPDAVRAALDAFDPALLLGFPALSTVDVNGRLLTRAPGDGDVVLTDDGVATRWRVRAAAGTIAPELLADRPVEEQERPQWSILAAVPVDADGAPVALPTRQLLHAPTPSDEPIGLPIRLIGTFPLDPARRRVPAGPLTDWLTGRAADVTADLIGALADGPAVLALLPPPGLAGGVLAATLRTELLARLRDADLPTAAGGRIPARRAVVVADALVEPLSDVLDGLLPAGWWTREHGGALAALGVRALGVPEVVAALTGVERPPTWWRRLYAALAVLPLEPSDREALAALPVPLADGRTVTGPARVLLPAEELPPGLDELGLLVVHADAAHPLLERLGAQAATPVGVLHDDRVLAAVADSIEAEDPEPVADAVLGLVEAAGYRADWLADLALPAADGDWYPAGDLLLPGSPLPDLLADDAPFGVAEPELLDRYEAATLTAVGVLETFAVLDETDVDLADVAELDLDGVEEWAAMLRETVGDGRPGLRVARLRAVRDLEWVRPDAWPGALELLAARGLRAVVAADCDLLTDDDERIAVPGYTRWWLARQPVLAGRRPLDCRTGTDSELVGLYDPAPGDPAVAAELGAHRGLADVLAAAAIDPTVATDLLDRLGDPDRHVAPELLAVVHPRLAATLAAVDIEAPASIRVAPDTVVPADRAVVVDQPWLLDRLDGRHPVLGGGDPVAVADFLDIPLLSELPARAAAPDAVVG